MEQRGAWVNQGDLGRGWTPLHRCAHMAHHTHAPFLATFEYLLMQGADASILSSAGPQSKPLSAVQVAVSKACIHQAHGNTAGEKLLAPLVSRCCFL